MKRKFKASCEFCKKKLAQGFGFKMPEDFDKKVEIYRALEQEHLEPLPILHGETLKEACDSTSPLRQEIRKHDKFAKDYFPKDDCVLTCGNCADENGIAYYVSFSDFNQSFSETVDWICHLEGKQWMSWPNFVAACKRLRKF